jgi:transcriptional regulator with XRE-family HTH domain
MTLGDRVKHLREKQGMTQEELAQKLGKKSKSTVAHIETGNRDIPRSMVVELAKILNVSPCYLMGWEEEKNNAPVEVDKSVIASLLKTFSDEELHKIAELSREEAVEVVNYIDNLSKR